MENSIKELEEYEIITKRTERRIIIEERIKKHFKENQNKYKIAGLIVTSVVGTIAAIAAYQKIKTDGNTPQNPKQDKKVKNPFDHVPALGHRGNVIYDETIDDFYGSLGDASRKLNVNKSTIRRALDHGGNVNGHILTKQGENLTEIGVRPLI